MLVDLQFKAIFARTVVTAIAVDAVMLAARVSHVALICICREKAKRKKYSLTQHSKMFQWSRMVLGSNEVSCASIKLDLFSDVSNIEFNS